MNEDILLRFLSNGLINVGGDDAKLEKLRTTAKDLAESLKKTPSKASAYSLIAFDPQAPVDDPVMVEALTALRERWATYVNTFSATPIAVIRAILLDALNQAANDLRIGIAFVASARNALPFIEAGNERAIWVDIVSEIERRVDVKAESEWATPESIAVPTLNFDIPDIGAPKVSHSVVKRDALTEKMQAAAGPVVSGGNPHWPQNNPSAWATEIGKRMAEAVAEVVDGVAKSTKVELVDLSSPFKALAASASEYVSKTIQAVSAATAGLQRRTNLLWWREACFSPSARVSYRDLSITSAAILMAYDLHSQIPTFSPASVAAFLFEAVESLAPDGQRSTYSLKELVSEAQENPALALLRDAAAELLAEPVGRGPILALVAYPESPLSRSERDFLRLTGVSPDTEIGLSAWAAWMFREFQAARAVYDAPETKRRVRRA